MILQSARLLFVLILLAHSTIVSSLTTCPRQCICHEHSIACSCETADKPELIISSLGSTYITSLVVHTCDKVTVLNGSFSGVVLVERLSFIAIGRLYFEPHAFKDILQSPRQLVIDECSIPSLAPVAFAGLSHIDHLWFRNSRVDVIATEAFHYLTNIDYIYFHRTKIGRIERRAFSKMYQIDHLYFKEAVEIGMIESEAFAGSHVDELILDGVAIEDAHDTFLVNLDAETAILTNCTVFLIPRKEESVLEIDGEQRMVEKCLIESSTFNSMSPFKMGCVVLEVTSSTIDRIGPTSRNIDTPVYIPEPAITSDLNSIVFSNCTIGCLDTSAFLNYTLSILAFNHTTIDVLKPKCIEKSRIGRLAFHGSTLKSINSSFLKKTRVENFDVESSEIEEIDSDWINNCSIRRLRILRSKIERMARNAFKDSDFKEIQMDGNRIQRMDEAALHGNNQISFLSITDNELSTSSPSPSLLSPSPAAHPTSFLLANNTLDCSPADCSTNSFLLNSPKHSPLLYQISHNRCRPPVQKPCVEPRSVNLEEHGLTCRISSLVADCACVSSLSSFPSRFPIDANVSIVIVGDCEHLTLDQKSAPFTQIYIFRTAKLMVYALPRPLKILKIFHSTVSLLRVETRRSDFPQDWHVAHSNIDRIGAHALSHLELVSLRLQHSRLPHIPPASTRNSSIGSLIIENCFLESTQPLFEISRTLQMQHSIVFSSPRGLGTISSAQLQNNTLLECCRRPYVDHRTPLGLDGIDLDARCDLHFYGARCFDVGQISTNHLPIISTSISNALFSVYSCLLLINSVFIVIE